MGILWLRDQAKCSKHVAENNLSTRIPQGGQTAWHRVTHPPHAGSPVQKQRQTGSPVQHTPGHPSKNSQRPNLVQGGLTAYQGRLDRLPLKNSQQHKLIQSRDKSLQRSTSGLWSG